MAEETKVRDENILHCTIDKTLYEISVIMSENARESAEDILVRLIAADTDYEMEDANG